MRWLVSGFGMYACRWVAQFFTWGSVVWCVNVRRTSCCCTVCFCHLCAEVYSGASLKGM